MRHLYVAAVYIDFAPLEAGGAISGGDLVQVMSNLLLMA
jgi:hypothetical protein